MVIVVVEVVIVSGLNKTHHLLNRNRCDCQAVDNRTSNRHRNPLFRIYTHERHLTNLRTENEQTNDDGQHKKGTQKIYINIYEEHYAMWMK